MELLRTTTPVPASPRLVAGASAPSAPSRETWDAGGSETPAGGLGRLARSEGQAPTGDPSVDQAHDNAGLVHEFFATVLGRDSIDGRGMKLTSVAHFGTDFNNAYWDGEKMTYGDGDGKTFSPLSGALDVVAHEMAHGMTEHTAKLAYRNQSGALNESWSDVFGELVEQWAENRQGFGTPDAARAADWLIGEDVFTPGTPGDALRSMKAPGTAYAGDPQPGHMRDYRRMTDDNGGVHVNSGIPNRAAYEAGLRIGGEKLAKIWYSALTDHLRPTSSFQDAANATLAAATALYGAGEVPQAVQDAWKAVGIVTREGARPARPSAVTDHGHVAGKGSSHDGVVPPWLLDGRIDAAEQAALGT